MVVCIIDLSVVVMVGGDGVRCILAGSAPDRSAPESFAGRLIFAPESGFLLGGADSVPGRIFKVR